MTKILFFADQYGAHNFGTKKSLYNALNNQKGIKAVWVDKSEKGKILQLINAQKPDQIWLAHTGLTLGSLADKVKIPIIGFSFSDPYVKVDINSFTVFVTNYWNYFEKFTNQGFKVIYNPTACDILYHHRIEGTEKIYDCTMIGQGNHPRFHDKAERIKLVNLLRKANISVHAFGHKWPKCVGNHPHISDGKIFLQVINQSKLGLDIQDERSPLAHRMLEYSTCGVPVITRKRPEIEKIFSEDEILTYTNESDFVDKVKWVISNPYLLAVMGEKAMKKCISQHNISHRINHIFCELRRFGVM